MSGYHRLPADQLNVLSSREMEVLRLVAMNLPNKQIANKLHLSLSTVKNHMVSILAKTKTASRREAVWQVLGIEFSEMKKCDQCQVGAKAQVIASEMRRLAEDLDK